MKTPVQPTRVDRAATNAPSLLLAYATYLVIAAITVSAGGHVPQLVVWSVIATVAFATSRYITPGWSLYNGLAAALFFASFASRPFGDVHIHHLLGWLAVVALVLTCFIASTRHHDRTSTRRDQTRARTRAERLPWMNAIPPIDAGAISTDSINKEETWRT
ncbi:MAG TPA: hypothetical protein VKV69_02385 [Actinomycetota bacterium]|nr:hypothetical protein [Actinomycetota bacterium]